MHLAVRYTNQKRALEVGRTLASTYPPDFLTGLNFIIEPDQSVIVIAVFDDKNLHFSTNHPTILMLPGETINATIHQLIDPSKPRTMMLLGDGLGAFELYYRARHGLGPHDPINPHK